MVPVLGLLLSASAVDSAPPPLSTFFAGLGDTNTASPPDTHGAVGSNYLMETLSTQVRVQTQTGAVAFGPVSLNAFWSAGSGPNPNNSGATDPRVVYDPFANRWVVVSCDESGSANSRLLVGVSKSPIPDLVPSNWFRDAIDVDPGSTLWAREATVGFSNQWVVVQVNIYRISDNLFDRSHIYVFDKSQMYSGNLLTSYNVLNLDGATYRSTQVPATTYDIGVNDVYLLQMWDAAAGQLRLYRITGAVSSPSIVWVGDPTQGAWIGSPGDIEFAPQLQGPPGCQYCPSPPCRIRIDDSRIQNVVYRNGKVWTTHTVVLPSPNRSSVQWWQIRTDATIAQHGLVDDPFGQRYFAFPSIAVNKNDDVLLGYSRFEGDEYAGASYSFRTAIDPPDTMQSEGPLKDGDGCYYKDFGLIPPRSLWGHHSATVVDPTDDKKMWTLQQYAAAPNVTYPIPEQRDRWGTWWGMLDPTPAIAIADGFAVEGDSGTTPMTFDLTLSVPTSQAVTVTWATDDGSAETGDNDYVGASGTVVFAPGETAKTVTVAVKGDIKKEGLETFVVNFALGAPVNATLPDTQAVGSIADDDPDPQISISDKQVLEGSSSGPTPAVFLVTLSNPSSSNRHRGLQRGPRHGDHRVGVARRPQPRRRHPHVQPGCRRATGHRQRPARHERRGERDVLREPLLALARGRDHPQGHRQRRDPQRRPRPEQSPASPS